MEEAPGATETPTVATAGDDFGPPHAVQISQSLQLWILLPGLLVFVLIGKPPLHASVLRLSVFFTSVLGYLIYRLMDRQKPKKKKKEKKK